MYNMVKAANVLLAKALDHTQHYTIYIRKPKFYIKIWLYNPKDRCASCFKTLLLILCIEQLPLKDFQLFPPSSTQNSEKLTYSKLLLLLNMFQ